MLQSSFLLELQKDPKHPFWNTLKCYALLEFDKPEESIEMLPVIRPTKQTDPVVVQFLVLTLVKFSRFAELTKMLENAQKIHTTLVDINEELFFAFVREQKLLQQQNQALHLYELDTVREAAKKRKFATWVVQSMTLVFSTVKVETKILDIGYLLLLKIMKEPGFKLDLKFVLLYIDVMTKQKRFKEAIDFVEEQGQYFESQKQKDFKMVLTQDLLFQAGQSLLTINNYFIILRFNSNVHNFKEIYPTYRKCIRYLVCSYLKVNGFDLSALQEVPEYISADNAYSVEAQKKFHGFNFEQVGVGEEAETVLINCLYSLKNLRKNTDQIDTN